MDVAKVQNVVARLLLLHYNVIALILYTVAKVFYSLSKSKEFTPTSHDSLYNCTCRIVSQKKIASLIT